MSTAMSQPTVSLIDVASYLPGEPIPADYYAQFADSEAIMVFTIPDLYDKCEAASRLASTVREIAVFGGDVTEFVHPIVAAELRLQRRV